jgi:hypothetical protein
MQFNLAINVETDDETRLAVTVKETGEQCDLCTGVSKDDAVMRIGSLIDRWADEVARLEL